MNNYCVCLSKPIVNKNRFPRMNKRGTEITELRHNALCLYFDNRHCFVYIFFETT